MKSSEIIFEAGRIPGDPDVAGYEEVPKKKTEPDVIDQVIVTLQGKRSEKFTRIARRYDEANKIKKELATIEKTLKADTREAVDDLFDAGDEIYSRVVETASLVFKVAKAEERETKKLDEAGFLDELAEVTGLAVAQLKALQTKHTKITKAAVAPKVLAPREKKPKKESVNEGALDNVRSYAAKVKNYVMSFLSKWDRKYNKLKANIEAVI